jgi:RES domain-containing protein
MVYTASSQALAILEIFIHCQSEDLIRSQFVTIPISIPDDCILTLGNNLPKDWDTYPASISSRMIGDNWVAENASAVLAVPSVVAPLENNFLLNPKHPDFKKIVINEPIPFEFDQRLKAK